MNAPRRQALLLGAAGLAAAAGGFFAGPALLRLAGDPATRALRAARFNDLDGKPRSLAEWQGRILLCNFWATWCEPCREEIPLLLETRRKLSSAGFEIVGIAIDNAPKVRQFAASFNITYPILLAEADGLDLMRALGNISGGLPYTVIAGREGRIEHRKLGALKAADLDRLLAPMVGG